MLKKLVAFTCLTLSIGSNAATVFLDQEFDASGTSRSQFTGEVQLAQIFRVGVTGILSSIDIQVQRYITNTPVNFELRHVIDGIPAAEDENVITSISLEGDLFSTTRDSFVNIELSSYSIDVVAGDVLAIVLSNPESAPIIGDYRWSIRYENYGGTDFYNDGGHCRRVGPETAWYCSPISGDGARDYGFRTYVSAVPLPAAAWLFGSALLGLGAAKRRKA